MTTETQPKRGRGRPPIGPGKRFSVTLADADAAEYAELGGLEWLRATLQASAAFRATGALDAKESTCKD